jgi:deoxyhypusine synthase
MADYNVTTTATPPSKATDAVLVASDPVPEGAHKVHGIDFNAHHAADISVAELVDDMANMGFQASAIAEAVQIINHMVCPPWIPFVQVQV